MYIYAKFIWKKKVNGGLDEARIRKRIQQSATLIGELFAKITLKKEQMEYIFLMFIKYQIFINRLVVASSVL
jgi:hypothetical protein